MWNPRLNYMPYCCCLRAHNVLIGTVEPVEPGKKYQCEEGIILRYMLGYIGPAPGRSPLLLPDPQRAQKVERDVGVNI